MSVYAKGLLEKALRDIEFNYERHKREEKEHGR